MPVYEYLCQNCGQIVDEYKSMEQRDNVPDCPICAGETIRAYTFRGGIKTDHPAWLNNHVREVLQKDGEKPIENRKEHDQYLKDNGIIQK